MSDEAERHRLSPEQHESIFRNDIVPELTAGAQPAANPRAVILGGQPGAGKSAIQSAVEEEMVAHGGCLSIIGDDLRAFHPSYQRLMREDDKTAAFYTDRDSGQWVEKLIRYARESGFNVLIESTMRVPDKICETARAFRDLGYTVEARAVAVDGRLSTLGIHQRYESILAAAGHARFTVPSAHDAAYHGMLETLSRLETERVMDRVAIYKRGNILIYENELSADGWRNPTGARAAVETERSRPWTAREKLKHAQDWKSILEQRKARNASSTDLEFAESQHSAALRAVDAGSPANKELDASRTGGERGPTKQERARSEPRGARASGAADSQSSSEGSGGGTAREQGLERDPWLPTHVRAFGRCYAFVPWAQLFGTSAKRSEGAENRERFDVLQALETWIRTSPWEARALVSTHHFVSIPQFSVHRMTDRQMHDALRRALADGSLVCLTRDS